MLPGGAAAGEEVKGGTTIMRGCPGSSKDILPDNGKKKSAKTLVASTMAAVTAIAISL